MPYYAVAIGRKPGIYNTWEECKKQVIGSSYARYKKFDTETAAKQFCQLNGKYCATNPVNSGQVGGNKRKLLVVDDDDDDDCTVSAKSSTLSNGKYTKAGAKDDYSDTVIVYTDGACVHNGKKDARAGN